MRARVACEGGRAVGTAWSATPLLGIIGAMVGGFLSSTLPGVDVTGFNVTSLIIALVRACIVIAILRMFTGKRQRS